MRTLLLTSAGMNVKDQILKILPKPANQIKIAHIITAVNKQKKKDYYYREIKAMQDADFDVKEIDLEGKTEQELKSLLTKKDIIYVQGGNTFWLLKHVRSSGFDKIIKELLDQGVIYIGVSAGSYIACPTIEMSLWKKEQPEVFGLTDFTGMTLVPFLMSVHYKPEYAEILKPHIIKSKYPVKVLTDQQAILIKDNSYQLVGMGEEIKL